MKKTVIIIPDPYDRSSSYSADVDDVLAYLTQQFTFMPENTRIYHQAIALKNDITPKHSDKKKLQAEIDHIQSLDGVFYVVIYPSYDPFTIIYYAVVAIMAAYSVYTILTMPKPEAGNVGSSNNELANRTNQMRLGYRIPDIYGRLRAYPDLIAVVYTYYLNEIEVEECLMCLGRGYYEIHDVKDADTAAEGIPEMAVSFYNPNTYIMGFPMYQVGQTFNDFPLAVRKSASINGQSLKSPNDIAITDNASLYFTTGGVVRTTGGVDFTQYFAVGDGVAVANAQFGLGDASLSGECAAHTDFTITVATDVDVVGFDTYRGLILTGATFEYDDGTTIAVKDLSGNYEVSSVSRALLSGGYTYVIQLISPKQVNYNWNFIDGDYDLTAGITLNLSTDGMNLDDTYSISSISSDQMTFANAATVNPEWNKVPSLFNGSTQGQAVEVSVSIVANKWVGWFDIYEPEATHINFNVYFPQGMYNYTNKGSFTHVFCDITIEYQSIDSAGNPISPIQREVQFLQRAQRDSFGMTYRFELPQKGNVRFRLAKTREETRNSPVTECKIKDVYAYYRSLKLEYPDITVVRTRQVATDGALSLKERKLNCLVTRKLPVDGTGDLVATRDAGQALINMGLDPYIGRRSSNEIDVVQIKSEIQSIKDYFGSPIAAEFSYTFDDDKLSFEEQAGMIASACFCETVRYGNKLRLKFEKPQQNSVLLFNHRNKVPGSEKRTLNPSIDKDYDGVELEYTSPDDDSRVTYSIYYDAVTDTAIESGLAKNPLKITTSGIRNVAVAKTRAWREMNKLLYQNMSVEFTALDESELLIRNDRILVADNTSISTQDGEVIEQDVLTLTMSQDVLFVEGQEHYCYLQLADGSVDMILCTPGENMNQIVLSRAPLMPLVIDHDRYVKTLYSIVGGNPAIKRQAFMLSEMSPNDQMTNKLTCINYSDRYYEKDHSYI